MSSSADTSGGLTPVREYVPDDQLVYLGEAPLNVDLQVMRWDGRGHYFGGLTIQRVGEVVDENEPVHLQQGPEGTVSCMIDGVRVDYLPIWRVRVTPVTTPGQ